MQSCDICRKRKVKCDRSTPCARCRRLRQPCTYTEILRKKGPKFVHSYPSIYSAAAPYTSTPTSSETLASASGSNEVLPLLTSGLGLDLDLDMGINIDMEGFTGGASETMTGTGTTSGLDDELELELNFGDASPVQQQLQRDLETGIGLGTGPNSNKTASNTSMERALSLYAMKLYPLFPVVDVCELRLGFRLGHEWNDEYSSSRYALLCSICAAVHAYLGFDSTSSRQELGHENGHEHELVCERYLHGALRARSQYDFAQHQFFGQERQSNDGE